jgi:hypothetical protein
MAFERCKNDEACNSAFPDFQNEFVTLMKKVKEQPQHLKLNNPLTGKPYEFDLTSTIFSNVMFAPLYAPEMVSLLPLAVHSAAQGDFAPLFTQAGSMDSGLYNGMFYAVVCSEDAPLVRADQAEAIASQTSLGDMTLTMREICMAWPQTSLPADFRAPLPSNLQTPVLVLSGEADPVTPPIYGDQVAKMLPNSLHIVAPKMGHGILTRGCMPRVAADFISRASVKDLDFACVQKIEPDPFFISFTGSKP